MNIELPENIRKILLNKEFKVNTVGKTNSQVYMYNNMVLKIQNQSNETENEIEIMQKISENLPIPKVIEQVDKEGLSYTLMSRIEGNMLSEKEYVNNLEILINLLCEGLKMLWDIDINQYDIKKVSNIYERLKSARFNVENNLVDVNNVMPETFGKDGFSSPKELLEWLENNIPSQDLVFTHGDFCFENIFAKNGHINGFIDLGKAGIADRWQDLAICIRELDDLNPNYSNLLLSKLGIEKDDFKLKYYMLLDELF